MKNIYLIFSLLLIFFYGCNSNKEVDTIIKNANIYTLEDTSGLFKTTLILKDGKILEVGTDEILPKYTSKNIIDAKGQFIYPGFYDGHCHFYGYASTLLQVDLVGTTSFDEVLQRVNDYNKTISKDDWIIGRGWDQNDWKGNKEFPDNKRISELYPDKGVILKRVDGHAVLVNDFILNKLKITDKTKVSGGEVILINGKPSGILIDNAMDLVDAIKPKPSKEMTMKALQQAEKNCFEVGLTTMNDAGLGKDSILLIDELQKQGKLNIRLYAMMSPSQDNFEMAKKGIIKTDKLNVRAFKFYADGALGSRGACLLSDYSDRKGHKGFILYPEKYYYDNFKKVEKLGFQVCTHAIGDSANRLMIKLYGSILQKHNDIRWKIEHCQIVHPDDMYAINLYNIVPSIQPTHATSDMYWVEERLGIERVQLSAYPYKSLLKAVRYVVLGSDYPVESINPLYGYYAAITRKDQKGYPDKGFTPQQKLSRWEALCGMTRWAAYSNFEEKERGTLKKGKMADFVMMDMDLIHAPESELFKGKISETWVGGKRVFSRK
jgi:predicted amidohydrolase YtcJ